MKNFEVILTASELSHILPKCPELRYHRTDEIHQRHFCLSSLLAAGDQNLTKEKVTLGKIYFSRTLTKPHKSRMGAAAAQRVQAYMKRKEGKLLKLFDLILLKNLDICAGK